MQTCPRRRTEIKAPPRNGKSCRTERRQQRLGRPTPSELTLSLVTPSFVTLNSAVVRRVMAQMCIASGEPPPASSSWSREKVMTPRKAGKAWTESGASVESDWKVRMPSVEVVSTI